MKYRLASFASLTKPKIVAERRANRRLGLKMLVTCYPLDLRYALFGLSGCGRSEASALA